MIRFDARELREFGADLPRLGRAGGKVIHKVITEAGDELRDRWRENAKRTAGKHGRLYPASIEANLVPSFSAVVVDVGPNPRKPQGGMSFEFGSANQPAHLDGQLAADVVLPKLEGRATTAIFHLFEDFQ